MISTEGTLKVTALKDSIGLIKNSISKINIKNNIKYVRFIRKLTNTIKKYTRLPNTANPEF